MKKSSLPNMGVLLVSGVALVAITASQIASAQERVRQMQGNRLIGMKRITPSDPKFRSASALVLVDIKDKIIGQKIDMDMQGAFVWSDTIWNTTKGDNSLFTKTIFWFSPDQAGERARPMTAAQLALAQTIFTQANISRAKNVSVNNRGITGRVTAKELGMTGAQLTRLARQNVQKEMAMNAEALKGLGGR